MNGGVRTCRGFAARRHFPQLPGQSRSLAFSRTRDDVTETGEAEPEPDDERIGRLGACLQASFTAENHANLGDDLLHLLLHLSREPNPPRKANAPPAAGRGGAGTGGAGAGGPARFSLARLAKRFPRRRP
jgi:hypothetical protein